MDLHETVDDVKPWCLALDWDTYQIETSLHSTGLQGDVCKEYISGWAGISVTS